MKLMGPSGNIIKLRAVMKVLGSLQMTTVQFSEDCQGVLSSTK